MMEKQFSKKLLAWFDCHGRKDLPWQHPRSAYRVWISEIMLQQTQVKTVIPYYSRFMTSFPDLTQLAKAKEDLVLAHWSGLGYYSRARNLHKTAQIIFSEFDGEFPADLDKLIKLPGIGPSTAAAITSQAFNQATAILDGNVKRVLCRYFQVEGWPEQAMVKNKLWQLANQCMSKERCADYTQAIMDLGATCCTLRKPNCNECPLQQSCLAYRAGRVAEYPYKKVKRSIPTKQQQFLLLHQNDTIYLEKRPPTGVWGGLWCLPSINMEECPQNYIAKNYAFNELKQERLITIKHSFSHFHLEIDAIAIEISQQANQMADSPGGWFKASDLNQLGLAKPVNDIIAHFLLTYHEKKR